MEINPLNKTDRWKKEATTILDIGCGSNPEGTTNLDYFDGDTPHHKGFIDRNLIPNFIQGDAHNLPFEDNSFDLTIMSHISEHLLNPYKAFEEAYRVSTRTIVRVPNNPCIKEHPEHLYSWSKTSLFNLLKRHWKTVDVRVKTRPSYIGDSRIFKKIVKIPTVGQALARKYLEWLGLELVAYCEK